jgi:hypothetical protein
VNTPETWAAGSVIRPESEITGILEVGAAFLIFMEGAIYRIDGTDPTTWTLTRAEATGLGLPATASHTLMELEGVAVYLSNKGLAVYEGSRPRTISDAVKNEEDSTRNLIPTNSTMWEGAFLLVVGDAIWVFYRSTSGLDGCDRAMAYDYRRDTWSGPWTFAEPYTCGSCDGTLTGDLALPYLGGAYGHVWRQLDHTDAAPFTMLLRSKTFDCAREAVDKVVIEMRATYKAAAATSITMRLFRESETTACVTVVHTVAAAGEGVISKRVPHLRGRDFYMELESSDGVYVEFGGCEFDYFFVPTR